MARVPNCQNPSKAPRTIFNKAEVATAPSSFSLSEWIEVQVPIGYRVPDLKDPTVLVYHTPAG